MSVECCTFRGNMARLDVQFNAFFPPLVVFVPAAPAPLYVSATNHRFEGGSEEGVHIVDFYIVLGK